MKSIFAVKSNNKFSFIFQAGQGVPILLPSLTRQAMSLLNNKEARRKARIPDSNHFLFANTSK